MLYQNFKVKNDGHSPEVVEKSPKLPTEVAHPVVPGEDAGNVDQSFEETEKSVIDSERPRLKNKEENSKDGNFFTDLNSFKTKLLILLNLFSLYYVYF